MVSRRLITIHIKGEIASVVGVQHEESHHFSLFGERSVCQTIFLMYLLTFVNQRTRLIHQIPRGNNISPRWRICATFYRLFISCCYYFPLITFHLPPRCRFPQMGFRYRAVKMAFIYHQLFVRYNAFSHLVETFFVYFLPGKHYHNTKKEAFMTIRGQAPDSEGGE